MTTNQILEKIKSKADQTDLIPLIMQELGKKRVIREFTENFSTVWQYYTKVFMERIGGFDDVRVYFNNDVSNGDPLGQIVTIGWKAVKDGWDYGNVVAVTDTTRGESINSTVEETIRALADQATKTLKFGTIYK